MALLSALVSKLRAFLFEVYIVLFNPRLSSPSSSSTATVKCRYLLSPTATSRTFALPSTGRLLSYALYGCSSPEPPHGTIVFLHGFPGSRLEGAYLHDLGVEMGVRIVGMDRPGLGKSAPHPGRTLEDTARDVEALMEELGVQKFAVLGVSGGGPSALACAHYLPASKLAAVALVCALGPPDIGMRGADLPHRVGFPWGLRFGAYWMGRLFWRLDATGRVELPDDDRLAMYLRPDSSMAKAMQRPPSSGDHGETHNDDDDVLNEDVLRMSLAATREAFAQGYDTVWDDGALMCRPWPFDLRDIREDLPVLMWYGSDDVFVPLRHGLEIAARVGEGAALTVEAEAHAGIFLRTRRAVVEGLVRYL